MGSKSNSQSAIRNSQSAIRNSQFERWVDEAIEALPPQLRERIENLAVQIQPRATRAQRKRWDIPAAEEPLGFYDGIPLSARTSDYGLVPPDIIYIFTEPIREMCATEAALREETRRTVWHEIAHYFGIDDERLEELGRY